MWLVPTIECCIAALARRKKEGKETCRKKKKGRRIIFSFYFSFPPIRFLPIRYNKLILTYLGRHVSCQSLKIELVFRI